MTSQNSTHHRDASPPLTRLAVAGASGSIGTALCRELSDAYEITALTRSLARSKVHDPDMPLTWKFCDFFSMRSVEEALSGADYAIYLIHTRIASARLDQAASEDMDILVADNFARAAKKKGIKQILYLGSLIPEGDITSPLIRSRQEIAEVLASRGTPVTTLRASLIVGPGSSVINLLANIIERAPFVIIPRWALTRKQPIALPDVLRAVRFCLGKEEFYGNDYDIGGKDLMNFRELVEAAEELLGKRKIVLTFPFFPRRLYYWWVRLLDWNAHPGLVRLLVEALQYSVSVKSNPLQDMLLRDAMPGRQALDPYLEQEEKKLPPNPRSAFKKRESSDLLMQSRVRSIQRLRLPRGQNAAWVADYYFPWLSRFLRSFVLCEIDREGSWSIYARFPRLHIMELTFHPEHSTPDRRMYFITGGLLARVFGSSGARLEFRDILGSRFTVVAIHDFRPYLSWYFYIATQAVIHKFVMRAFQKEMARLADQAR
jgi:uncharacterized protein YbjT (DUF2867 family)